MIKDVKVEKLALKQLKKAPVQVQMKFYAWVKMVTESGLMTVRRIPGFHDEPLTGKLKGFRSIRLNDQWRAFYTIASDGSIEFVQVKEVNAHEYKP